MCEYCGQTYTFAKAKDCPVLFDQLEEKYCSQCGEKVAEESEEMEREQHN